MITSLTTDSAADRPRLARKSSIERPRPIAKRAHDVRASARMWRYVPTGAGIGMPNADQETPTKVERTIGFRMTWRARVGGRRVGPLCRFQIELQKQDGGGKHDHGNKHSCDRRRQHRRRP